jgi:hypothetical protein
MKAKVFQVCVIEIDWCEDPDQAMSVMNCIDWKYKFPDISRGDIIHNEYEGDYRNDGIYFWDGNKVIEQYVKLDEYGSVPPDFCILSEFPPRYWDLEHNTIEFVDWRELCITNDICVPVKHCGINLDIWIYSVSFNGETYQIMSEKDISNESDALVPVETFTQLDSIRGYNFNSNWILRIWDANSIIE